MANINANWVYIYTWLTGSWTPIQWKIPITTQDLTCDSVQTALNDWQAPTAYPVDCDFTTLTNTWVVFFMDPWNQQLTTWVEVETIWTDWITLTEKNIQFVYYIEVACIWVILLIILLIRQFRKFVKNKNFFNH